MKIKYQIFVSSTYEDLKSERDVVIKAILEMGHIPVGMEMFSAGDEKQWQLIQRQIDDCDYYIVILAHRYGSMDGTVSYTEKEYDYAVSKGVPALGFIIDDKAKWPKINIDTEPKIVNRLNAFKDKVKLKMVGFWNSVDDLHAKVSIALVKEMTTNPRVGWVRASETVGPEVMIELSRLSRENSTYRKELELLTSTQKESEQLERDKIIEILKKNEVVVLFMYTNDKDWGNHKNISLYTIFRIIAPELMVEKSIKESAAYLGTMLNENQDKQLRFPWPIPSNSIKEWFADLVTLNLVKPSDKKHQVSDTNEYWTLSEEGKIVYMSIRRSRLEAGITDNVTSNNEEEKKTVDAPQKSKLSLEQNSPTTSNNRGSLKSRHRQK